METLIDKKEILASIVALWGLKGDLEIIEENI